MLDRLRKRFAMLWEVFIEAQEMRAKARAQDIIKRYSNNGWI